MAPAFSPVACQIQTLQIFNLSEVVGWFEQRLTGQIPFHHQINCVTAVKKVLHEFLCWLNTNAA